MWVSTPHSQGKHKQRPGESTVHLCFSPPLGLSPHKKWHNCLHDRLGSNRSSFLSWWGCVIHPWMLSNNHQVYHFLPGSSWAISLSYTDKWICQPNTKIKITQSKMFNVLAWDLGWRFIILVSLKIYISRVYQVSCLSEHNIVWNYTKTPFCSFL